MTITPAAAELIRRFLRGADVSRSAICLAQASDVPSVVDEAVRRGASQTEIRETFAKAVPEQRYLYPAVFPRSHFLWLTTTIDGFPLP